MCHLLHRSALGTTRVICATFTVLFLNLVSVSANADIYTNFFNIKLIDIPAGNYKMGSCKLTREMELRNEQRTWLGLPELSTSCGKNDQDVNDNETPQHIVNIQAFKIGVTPITLGQYKKYLLAIGVEDEASSWNLINEEFNRLNGYGENAPVVQVSWNEVREFLRWLNENKPASDPHIYRFITEAEWEYVCRAGEDHAYCGSNSLEDVGWVDLVNNNNAHQKEVATKSPNAWGVYDMTGNVWEWVEDIYHETYEGAPDDGSAWTVSNFTPIIKKPKFGVKWKPDTRTSRVLRGGSWRFGTRMARATYRLSGQPGNWYYGNGFRIAASLH